MKRSILIALLLLLWIFPSHAAEYQAEDCPFQNRNPYQIDCGFVSVPLDHANPEGETIRLAVAIIRSNNPDKAPDPVLYLEGGPGGAPVQFAPLVNFHYPFLSLALQNRDVILIDQRGMGYSQPAFFCTPFRSLDEAFTSDYNALFSERMPACLEQFQNEGLAWQYFTTEQNALDLAMVGEALGYEKVNLQGTSYGTLLALIILREHPEVVRSAILDSVLSPSAQPFAESAQGFDAALTQLEAECDADFICGASYPNLRESFENSYARLANSPESFELNGIPIHVTAASFSGRVRYMLANRETARLVPAFIIGVENHDYAVIEDFAEQVFSVEVSQLPNQALYMTMVCPQGASNTSLDAIETAQAAFVPAFRTGGFSTADYQLCQVWGETLPFETTMPQTTLPVLMLSGDLDPLTPSYWADEATQGLSNSQHIIMPHTSHEVLRSSCGQAIATAFLENPESELDTACITEVEPISFILHTTVTRLPIFIASLLLSAVALYAIALMLFAGLKDFKRTAWWVAFRKQGYFPLLALIVIVLLVLSKATILPEEFVTVGIVQSIIPLLMALQSAAVFAPSDEAALEVQLAAPRSMVWLLTERLLVVILTYSAIAFVGIALTLMLETVDNLPALLVGWLPPALFLSGLGVYVSLKSRVVALGVILIGFLWFIFALFAPFFLPGQSFPAPFHIIQPYLWSVHVHASLQELSLQDFWLNRLFLAGAGLTFMLGAAFDLRDSESLLLGAKSPKANAKVEEKEAIRLKPKLSFQAVTVKIQPLAQIWGIIRYEFIMRWRGRGLWVFMLTPLVMQIVFTLSQGMDAVFFSPYPAELYTQEQLMLQRGELLAAIMTTLFFVPNIFLYPILAADSLPNDKRLAVDEILNALAVADWVQLLGRALGIILAGLSAFAIATVALGVFSWFFDAPFALAPLFDMFLGLAFGMSILTALTIFIGASQSSARQATAFAIALLILPEFIANLGFYISKAQYIIIYTMAGFVAAGQFPPQAHQWVFLRQDFLNLMAQNLLFLGITAVAVFFWRRYTNGKQ